MSENNDRDEIEKTDGEPERQAQSPGPDAKKEAQGGEPISLDENTTRKVIFSLCYIWGILFFLPLILYKNDARATRHANEGLILFILSVVGNVVFGVLTRFGWFFGLIAGLYSAALLILGILGIVYVVTDRDKPLPLIGGIKLLK